MIYTIPWLFFVDKNNIKSLKKNFSFKSLIYVGFFPLAFLKKFINLLTNYNKLSNINFIFLVKATCFNSFKPSEIYYYSKLGIKSWETLSKFIPNSLSSHFHSYRRSSLNYSCNEAIEVLKDKRKIHLLTPDEWRPPFLFLSKKKRNMAKPPDWWAEALEKKGLIIKPNDSCAGKGIIKLFWDGKKIKLNQLTSTSLITYENEKDDIPDLDEVHKIWKNFFNEDKDLIVMPFLENNKAMPISPETVVFRVITMSDGDNTNIMSSWIEVPVGVNKMAIFNQNGINLPYITQFNIKEKKIFKDWSDFISEKKFNKIHDELSDASIVLHRKLPRIESVAWDWIIGYKKNFLLEGNSSYGLLVPQSFKYLNN